MNLNEMLKTILSATGLPVEQDEYDGNKDKYIIFTYEDEVPGAYGDNKPTTDTAYLQVQLVTPKNFNYFKLKKQIIELLETAGFYVKPAGSFLGSVYVGTEKIRQTVFEVKYTEQRTEEN